MSCSIDIQTKFNIIYGEIIYTGEMIYTIIHHFHEHNILKLLTLNGVSWDSLARLICTILSRECPESSNMSRDLVKTLLMNGPISPILSDLTLLRHDTVMQMDLGIHQ